MLNNIEAVMENNEIINLAVKLIWNATEKSVSSVIFNGETATVLSQDRSRSIIVDLNETDSVIIKGETYRKIIEEESQEESDKLMHDVQTNENNTLNLDQEVMNRAEKLSDDTVVKTTQPINKIFKSSKRTENDQNTPKYQDKVDNYEPEIMRSLKEEDLNLSDDDSPGWSKCEDCYGNKKDYMNIVVALYANGKARKYTSDSAKKKTVNCNKKRETFLNSL
ncbi:43672_t:CDS:2, partial [Gigaspora margarita]